jgi:hypothetical protein
MKPPRKKSMLRLGLTLVVISYLLLIPTAVLGTMGIGGKSWLYGKLSLLCYAINWLFFIVGMVIAGPEAGRLARRWLVGVFRRKSPAPQDD